MSEPEDPLADVDVQSATAETVDRDAVRAGLAHDRPTITWRAIAVCEVLAAEDLAAIDPFVDDLAPLVASENRATAQRAAGLLFARARDDPSVVIGHVEHVVSLLSVDTGGHRMLAANLLAKAVVCDPASVRPHFGAVVDAVADLEVAVDTEVPEDATIDEPGLTALQRKDMEESQLRVDARNKLVNVLVAVVEDDPRAVAGHADDVAALLAHDDAVVIAHAIDALTEYAKAERSLVEPYVEDLVDQLDHWDEVVRARAIRALGFAAATGAVDALRAVADEDENADVRALAGETADHLEGR